MPGKWTVVSFWLLERCESGQVVQHQVPCMWAEAQHDFRPLDSGQALESEWPGTLQTYGDAGVLEELAEPGCYRVQFPVSLRPPWVSWGSERMEIHSAEFTIW